MSAVRVLGCSIGQRKRSANALARPWQFVSVASILGSSWPAKRSLRFHRIPSALLVAIESGFPSNSHSIVTPPDGGSLKVVHLIQPTVNVADSCCTAHE